MLRRIALTLLPIVLVACGGNDDPQDALVAGELGAAGGTLAADGGTPSLTVPPGALTDTLTFRIDPGAISIVPGFVDVGTATSFTPADPGLAAAATVVIRFDPQRVPAAASTGDLRVGLRKADGQVVALVPTLVDATAGTATCESTQLGTFWLAAPDILTPSSLFPLGSGDSYTYTDGTILTVSRVNNEPNFGSLELAKLTVVRGGSIFGYYMDDQGGDLGYRGIFDSPAFQIVEDTTIPLLQAGDSIGTVRVASSVYSRYWPYGTSIGAALGFEQVTTQVIARENVSTAVGTFATVRVRMVTNWVEDPGGSGTGGLEMWLADGIGPVQLAWALGPTVRLRSGIGGGQPITGN